MAHFFSIYVLSVSIARGAGIVLFTVQHNFKHAYASDSKLWDRDTGAIEGTSYLVLPRWLNWFTVDIGYHHIHHLSASRPELPAGGVPRSISELVLERNPREAERCPRRVKSVAEYQSARSMLP
jgi:fatty acid desaturase